MASAPSAALGAAGGPITQFFYGTISRANGEPRASTGTPCTVTVRPLQPVCLVTITCGDYKPFVGSAFASCSIDHLGMPHGEMHFGSPGPSPTDLSMSEGRVTIANTRSGEESVVEIQLQPDKLGDLKKGASPRPSPR